MVALKIKIREEDPERWMKVRRESKSRGMLKRRAEDPDAGKENNRKWVTECRAKQNEENPDAVKENNRKWVTECRAKKNEENPAAVKRAKKEENDARRSNGQRKFKEEQKYGHIFPCACCHTKKSRDQVVELNQQQADKIEGKAREYHQTLQVNSLYTHIQCLLKLKS